MNKFSSKRVLLTTWSDWKIEIIESHDFCHKVKKITFFAHSEIFEKENLNLKD